jgi:hypothetical protein
LTNRRDDHPILVRQVGRVLAGVCGLALVHAATVGAIDGTTVSPSPGSPSPGSSGAPGHLFEDDFTTDRPEARPWWTGSDDFASSAYADGGMRWQLHQNGLIWDTIAFGQDAERVRVSADVIVEAGSGGGGPVCGTGGNDDGRYLWAGINGDGEWLVGRIIDRRLHISQRGERPNIRRHDVPTGDLIPWRVTLECSTDPLGGGDRVTVWIQDVQVADIRDEQVGPYDLAGLAAASDGPGLAILFDDFVADDAAAVMPIAAPHRGTGRSASGAPSSAP